MTVDDLVGTRQSMDRRSGQAQMAWGPVRSAAGQNDQSVAPPVAPDELLRPLDSGEISVLLRDRGEDGWLQGLERGYRDGFASAEAIGDMRVLAESKRWVEVALEFIVRELGPVAGCATVAHEKAQAAHAAATTKASEAAADEAVVAAADAGQALVAFKDRLRKLQGEVRSNGVPS